jgi:glutathione S-transferase
MITLYHGVHTRSSVILTLLEEIGQTYQLKVLNMKEGEHRRAPYTTDINPMGKVPAIEHNGVAITETGAIATYLADAFPEAKLNIPLNDPRRGPYLKWMFFSGGCLEPALLDKLFERPEGRREAMGWGNYDLVVSVLTDALKTGPYLLGDTFTAADIVISAGLRWGMMMKGFPESPEFVAYADRLKARPATQRAIAKDMELANAA